MRSSLLDATVPVPPAAGRPRMLERAPAGQASAASAAAAGRCAAARRMDREQGLSGPAEPRSAPGSLRRSRLLPGLRPSQLSAVRSHRDLHAVHGAAVLHRRPGRAAPRPAELCIPGSARGVHEPGAWAPVRALVRARGGSTQARRMCRAALNAFESWPHSLCRSSSSGSWPMAIPRPVGPRSRMRTAGAACGAFGPACPSCSLTVNPLQRSGESCTAPPLLE